MIYSIKNLDTDQWINDGQQNISIEPVADLANRLIKSAVHHRQVVRLAIMGGNRVYITYETTGEAWYT